MNMPELSGEETFVALRAVHPDAAVILSSGYSPSEVAERLVAQGRVAFLGKPYDPGALAALARELLDA